MEASFSGWTHRGLGVVGLIAGGILLYAVTPSDDGLAHTVPPGCTDKYACTEEDVTDYGSYLQVGQRKFRGGVDGGADRWRMEFIQDYADPDGDGWYSWQQTWGPSGWATNFSLSPWYTLGPVSNYYADIFLWYRHQFEECTGSCYFWYVEETHFVDN